MTTMGQNRVRHKQSGFIAAPLIMGLVASFVALALAGNYINIFTKMSENQVLVKDKAKLEQIATLLTQASVDNDKSPVIIPPPMADTTGGLPLADGTPGPVDSVTNDPIGGRLPTGFSTITRNGSPRYFAYVHLTNASEPAPPAGYYVSGSGGIPKPNDPAFAIILPGKDGVISTSSADIKENICRGDDICAMRTVSDVNGSAYKDLLNNVGNIPTCGIIRDSNQVKPVHRELNWNGTKRKWECTNSDLQNFSYLSNVESCPSGMSLNAIQTINADGTQLPNSLTCMPTVAPRGRADFGLVQDDSGNVHSIGTDRSSLLVPCTGNNISTLTWNGTTPRCADGSGDTTGNNPPVSCEPGKYLASLPAGRRGCVAYTFANIPSILATPPDGGARYYAYAGTGARTRCLNNITPFYADGRTFCPEDQPGGKPMCNEKMDMVAAFSSTYGGVGCFVILNPNNAAGNIENTALRYAGSCPSGSVLQIASSSRYEVNCISMMDVISFAMPANTCPAQGTAGAGALTWNREQMQFTCTTVD